MDSTMNLFVGEAYWGGLTHFNDLGGYTEGLKELVKRTKYYDIFRQAALSIAPDEETVQMLLIRMEAYQAKIEARWKEEIGQSREQYVDSAHQSALDALTTWQNTHWLDFPELDYQPYENVLNKEAS